MIPSFHCVWCACPSSGSALFAPVFFFALAGCGGSAPTPPEPVPAERILEGFELGSGFHINPVPPEDAARMLRDTALD